LYGPNQRSGGAVRQLWRKLRLRTTETAPLHASLHRAVEHRALMAIAIGETGVANHIVRSSLELITQSGFAEYYDPLTGEPCGGGRFTWTAAMVVEFLSAQH
jgi:hypothetical protein